MNTVTVLSILPCLMTVPNSSLPESKSFKLVAPLFTGAIKFHTELYIVFQLSNEQL